MSLPLAIKTLMQLINKNFDATHKYIAHECYYLIFGLSSNELMMKIKALEMFVMTLLFCTHEKCVLGWEAGIP